MVAAGRWSLVRGSVGPWARRVKEWPRRVADGCRRGCHTWAPLLLLFLMVVVPSGLLAALGQFDGLYGQDPFAYYDYAIGPLRQSLSRLASLPTFYWPPGYPLLVALASFAVGPRPLAGQVVSLGAGGLVPVYTALLAREVWGTASRVEDGQAPPPAPGGATHGARLVPLVAGLLMALCGQLWQSSIVIMADTVGLATATAGVWALARYGRRGRPGWLVLAGAYGAWAILTRWAYVLVAIPCAVYACSLLTRRDRRTALAHGAAGALVVAIILGPLALPVLTGLLTPGATAVPFGADLQVYRWNPLNAARREFVTADGRLTYRLPNGLYYALAPARSFFFTPLLAWLILPGLWWVARRRTPAPLILLVGWAGVVYGFHAGAPWQNIRFTLAYLPPLAVLAALGLATLRRVTGRRGHWLLGLCLAAGFIWMAGSGLWLTQSFIARKDADLALVRAVQVPADAELLTFGLTLTFQHYRQIETLDLSELTTAELARLLAGDRPVFLLIDVGTIERQWRGRSPAENYHWLRDGPGLAPLGQYGAYTLFRVARAAAHAEGAR